MARILYGVCGVGIGHGIRSRVVLDYLKKRHKLFVITSQVNYKYLRKYFKTVKDVGGLEWVTRGNAISEFGTYIKNAKKTFCWRGEKLKKVEKAMEKFNPEVVISDWEPKSFKYGKRKKLPLVCLDNVHYIVYGKYDFPARFIRWWFVNNLVLKFFMAGAKYYLVMLFKGQKVCKCRRDGGGVIGVKPAIREGVLKARPERRGKHVLVYQSVGGSAELFDILRKIDEKFIIYGCKRSGRAGNLVFKKFDDGKGFINDLSGAKAVMTNGGFTLVSEAVHLGKPVLVVPIKKHFEQTLNGLHIKGEGLGECYFQLDGEKIKYFLSNLGRYKRTKTKQRNNSELFDLLDRIIKKEKGTVVKGR